LLNDARQSTDAVVNNLLNCLLPTEVLGYSYQRVDDINAFSVRCCAEIAPAVDRT